MAEQSESGEIFSLAVKCNKLLVKFGELLRTLGQTANEDDPSGKSMGQLAKNWQDRFNAWSSYLGVFADEKVSLDRRLERNPDIQQMIMKMLHVLFLNLQAVVELEENNHEDRDQSSIAAILSRIQEQKQFIDGSIDRLHRLGVTIRRSSMGSLRSRVDAFSAKSKTSIEDLCSRAIRYLYPLASESLREHLTQSIMRRYYTLLYREQHQKQISRPRKLLKDTEYEEGIKEKAADHFDQNPGFPAAAPETATVTKCKPTNSSKPSTKPSTLQNDIFRQKIRDNEQKTSYSSPTTSVVSSAPAKDLLYPRPPKKTGVAGVVTCSWCCEPLPESKYQEARTQKSPWWERHVNRDLKPYVCLAENCEKPPPTFDRLRLWTKHMLEHHSAKWTQAVHLEPEWTCGIGHTTTQKFPTRDALLTHMHEDHGEYFTPKQIDSIIRRRSGRSFRPHGICPFCYLYDVTKDSTVNVPAQQEAAIVPPGREAPQASLKRPLSETGRNAKRVRRVKFADETQTASDSGDSDEPIGMEPGRPHGTEELQQRALWRHIATHLLSLSFLTLRLKMLQERNAGSEEDDGLTKSFSSGTSGVSDLSRSRQQDPDFYAMELIFDDENDYNLLDEPSSASSASKMLKASKHLTFRVDNIPINHAEDFDRNLQAIAELNTDLRAVAASFVRRSLVRSDKTYLCATVSATTYLSGQELCARLSKAGMDYSYGYICDFKGITPLFEDINGAAVDIIAVPGIGSHALGSWKSPDSDNVWLRDFLPEDVPNIRVLLYGYDTTLPGTHSKLSIEDLGAILANQVAAFRKEDGSTRRPVIFIGHSLGGLVIKEALIYARRRRSDAIADLAKACFALFFFGVPNLGLRHDQLRTLVHGQPNEAFVHDLMIDNDSEPSTFLKRLADQFSEACKGQYRVMSFYERVPSPTIELNGEGKWQNTGPPSLLVTAKSAVATGFIAVADEDNIPLKTDHSGLVKYISKSQGEYLIVRSRIAECVEKAEVDVPRRFAEHSFQQPHTQTTEDCMRSLAFEEMDGRQHGIEAAAGGTFGWLLEHKALTEWMRHPRGLLWIKGKPGSGKSTLMKYALEKVPSLSKTQPLALSFFFHGQGYDLQKSLLGLFRSLLHQVLKFVPGVSTDIIDLFDHNCQTIGEPGKYWNWHYSELKLFLRSSLARILNRRSVVIFIDALDECGEDSAVELIEYLQDLLSDLAPTDFQLNVCFSCCHYPIIELNSGLEILLDVENKADIDIYLHVHLSAEQVSHYQSLIANRAQGVFVWACIIADRLIQMKRRGLTSSRIDQEIQRVPPELDGLYQELLENLDDCASTTRLVQWICFSRRPLTIDELSWAMVIDPSSPSQTLDGCEHSDKFMTQDNVDRQIINLSCGLAEIARFAQPSVVQFFHQSVKDYFVNRGLSLLMHTTGTKMTAAVSHHMLAHVCISYLGKVLSSHNGYLTKEDTKQFPLLDYATTSLISHIKLSEPAKASAKEILHSFGWPSRALVDQWISAYGVVDQRSWYRPSKGSSLVHIACRYDLQNLLLEILISTDKVDINSKDEDGRTPLSYAAEYGNKVVVDMLLSTGEVDIDSKDRDDRTPLSWAAYRGHEAVVEMLLETGKVDVNSQDKGGRTPLSYSAIFGHEAVVKILLESGQVDVDSKDGDDRTPLSWAAYRGHEAVVKKLLETGKVDVNSQDKDGRTPLSYSAALGYEAVVKILLDTGKVDIDLKDKGNRTPLSWAAEEGHEAVLKIFLAHKQG